MKRILAEGHAIGGHTWDAHAPLPDMKLAEAAADIEHGFAPPCACAGAQRQPSSASRSLPPPANSSPRLDARRISAR